jgi:hypothetical protein
MIFYINKQAVEIKTRFENAPLTSPNEACAAMGMLYKIYGLAIPEKREMVSQMKEDFHGAIKNLPVPSEFAAKIITLLDGYYKDDPVTNEIYELLKYSYEEQK